MSVYLIVFGLVLPWLLVAVGCWLVYQLMRQNGRILLRLDEIEKETRSGRGKANRGLGASRINRDGLKAGTPAPGFRLPRLEGGELDLCDYRGRRVVLVFSDPMCGPCDELAPQLERVYERAREPRIVMISRGDKEANRLKVAQHGLTFPVVLQKQWEVSRLYGMFATPIGYLIDEKGVIETDVAVGVDAVLGLLTRPVASEPSKPETLPEEPVRSEPELVKAS